MKDLFSPYTISHLNSENQGVHQRWCGYYRQKNQYIFKSLIIEFLKKLPCIPKPSLRGAEQDSRGKCHLTYERSKKDVLLNQTKRLDLGGNLLNLHLIGKIVGYFFFSLPIGEDYTFGKNVFSNAKKINDRFRTNDDFDISENNNKWEGTFHYTSGGRLKFNLTKKDIGYYKFDKDDGTNKTNSEPGTRTINLSYYNSPKVKFIYPEFDYSKMYPLPQVQNKKDFEDYYLKYDFQESQYKKYTRGCHQLDKYINFPVFVKKPNSVSLIYREDKQWIPATEEFYEIIAEMIYRAFYVKNLQFELLLVDGKKGDDSFRKNIWKNNAENLSCPLIYQSSLFIAYMKAVLDGVDADYFKNEKMIFFFKPESKKHILKVARERLYEDVRKMRKQIHRDEHYDDMDRHEKELNNYPENDLSDEKDWTDDEFDKIINKPKNNVYKNYRPNLFPDDEYELTRKPNLSTIPQLQESNLKNVFNRYLKQKK